MTPYEIYIARERDFNETFLQKNSPNLPRPSLMNKGLTNIKSHTRSTVLAVLRAELESVGGEEEHSKNCYFLEDGSYLDSHCTCGAIIRNQERNRIRQNLQTTIDNIKNL